MGQSRLSNCADLRSYRRQAEKVKKAAE